MKITMQENESNSSLLIDNCDVAVVGDVLDDRGKAAVEFLKTKANALSNMNYMPDDFKVNIDGITFDADDMDSHFKKHMNKTVYLEATTLGFVEIFLCCRALKANGVKETKLLYVEPQGYAKSRKKTLLNKRDFLLSNEFSGYRAIPGATFMLTDRYPQKGVFFLGYEERRLDRALEDYQMIQPANCSVVFGVPAFRPGWEMDAFANNIRVIRDKKICGGIYYCGAENPAATIDLLNSIYEGLEENQKMFIAPIGTKPNGIGAAIFASMNADIGILYDHPKRKEGRSSSVAKWHLYDVHFGEFA